jgi:hypothetical protein
MRPKQPIGRAAVLAVLGSALVLAGCVSVTTGPKPSSSAPRSNAASASGVPSATGDFAVGQSVAAVWSDGNLYLASITAVDGDQLTVRYADDSSTKTVAAAEVKPIPEKTWAVGDKVKAVWSSGRFYDGVITKASGASYEVKWDDGSAPSQVVSNKIIAR